MGVNEVSNSNQVKKTTNEQTNHHKKGNRKLAKKLQIRKLSQRLSEDELPSAGRLQLKAARKS